MTICHIMRITKYPVGYDERKSGMKRLVALLCAILLLFASATALAEIDLTKMTIEELKSLIAAANVELEKRNASAAEEAAETIIVDQNGVYLAFTETETHPNVYSLTQHFVLKNQSPYDLTITVKRAEVNGWGVTRAYVWVGNGSSKSKSFEAGTNYRDLAFDLNDLPGDAGVKKASDIKNVLLVISLEQRVSTSTKRTMEIEIKGTYTSTGALKVTSIKQIK